MAASTDTKLKSTSTPEKQPTLSNVGRFDVDRGGTTDDEEHAMPKIMTTSSNDKLEELHLRLDSEHALLRAIAKDGLVRLLTLPATTRLI